jgi:tetratricopeptide (TPR) repeat protein
MTLNRRLCGVLSAGLLAGACASARPLMYQECERPDQQLASVLGPLEALIARGCEPELDSRTDSECSRLRRQIERLALVCPNHSPTLMANAVIAYDDHNGPKAQQFLDRILSQRESSPDAAMLRARIALDEGNVPFARRMLEQQLKLAPAHAGLHETLGAALFLAGSMTEARRQLTTADVLGAPHWRIAYHLGLIEEAAGRSEQAINYFAESVQDNPAFLPAEAHLQGLRAGAPGAVRP